MEDSTPMPTPWVTADEPVPSEGNNSWIDMPHIKNECNSESRDDVWDIPNEDGESFSEKGSSQLRRPPSENEECRVDVWSIPNADGESFSENSTSQLKRSPSENEGQPVKRRRRGAADEEDITDFLYSIPTIRCKKFEDQFPLNEKDFQVKVFSMMRKLFEEIEQIKSSVKIMKRTREGVMPVDESSYKLPFMDNMEDVFDLETRLNNDPQYYDFMVERLTKLGGKSIKQQIPQILKKLMSHNLMSCFNMKGHNNKVPFANLKLYEVLIESCLANSGGTEKDVYETIAGYLKRAPARVGKIRY